MLLEESSQTRRIVGRLDRGQDAVDAITEICSERDIEAGEFSITGMIDELVLIEPIDGEAKPKVVFRGEGQFRIVQLSGTISVFNDDVIADATGLFAVSGPGGMQLVGGMIRSARVAYAEVRIDNYADLVIERTANFDVGRLVIDAIRVYESDQTETTERPEAVVKTPPGEKKSNVSWDEAVKTASNPIDKQKTKPRVEKVRALDETSAPEEDADAIYAGLDLDEPELSPGDILNHPKLGMCRVIKVEDDECAHIRLPKGQIRKLSLVVCDVEFLEAQDDGRNVFKVRINS